MLRGSDAHDLRTNQTDIIWLYSICHSDQEATTRGMYMMVLHLANDIYERYYKDFTPNETWNEL